MHAPLPDTAPSRRRHDIDALRVLAFGLLILYHVGMFYVADWGWHVKSVHLSDPLKWPMRLVNPWRMSLLFLISGIAVSLLLRRMGPRAFAGSRIRRLLVPLLFGMAVVVPPQAYVQAVANGAFEGNYAAFLVRYFTFQPWPADAFDGSHVGITWNHLWYLPYLLAYSLLVVALGPLLESRGGRALQQAVRGLRGLRLWLLPVVPLTVATWLLSADFPTTHDLLNDWHMHAQYFAMFLFGYWLGTDAGAWSALRAGRWWLVAAAVSSFAGFVFFATVTEPAPTLARATHDFMERLNAWSWLLMVLAWGHHLLDRPFPWLRYASESVYPWYVLHQTITVVAGFLLAKASLGPWVEPALLIAITVAGCLLINEYVIRRVGFLRPLFGLAAPRKAVAPPPVTGVEPAPVVEPAR